MKGRGIGGLILIIILLVSFPSVFADLEYLPVDGFKNRVPATDWTYSGSPPYLDGTGNYIYTKATGAESGNYSFADGSVSGTIHSVTAYFECQADDAPNDDGFDVYLYDGSWNNVGRILPSSAGSYANESLDVSGTLDTATKVTGAEMYTVYYKSKGANEVYIQRVWLYVNYTPSVGNDYYRDSVLSLSWSASGARIWEALRGASQALTFTGSGYRSLGALRGPSQSLAFSGSGGRIWSALRGPSQSLSFSGSGDRIWSALRGPSLAISFTGDAYSLLFTYFMRSVSVALNWSGDAFRIWSALRGPSQSLAFSGSGNRIWSALRGPSMDLTFVFDSFGSLLGGVINRSVSIALNLSESITRTWNIRRSLSLTTTFVSNAYGRIVSFINVLIQVVTSGGSGLENANVSINPFFNSYSNSSGWIDETIESGNRTLGIELDGYIPYEHEYEFIDNIKWVIKLLTVEEGEDAIAFNMELLIFAGLGVMATIYAVNSNDLNNRLIGSAGGFIMWIATAVYWMLTNANTDYMGFMYVFYGLAMFMLIQGVRSILTYLDLIGNKKW